MSMSRTLLSRPRELTIGAVVALTGLAVSVASAAPTPVRETVSMSLRGKPAVLQVENPGAASSFAYGPSVRYGSKVLLRNKVVVRTGDGAALRAYVNSGGIAGAVVEERLGETDAWVVGLPDVRSAVAFADGVSSQPWARGAEVDQGIVPDYAVVRESISEHMKASGMGIGELSGGVSARPFTNRIDSWGDQSPAGGGDPLEPSLFHHVNTAIGTAMHDNNIPPSVYDTQMATGAGVTIGLARYTFTNHIDRDHDDFENNFDAANSMPVDLTLEDDSVGLTRLAGLMVAERGNGIGAHGVAPGANVAGMAFGTNLQIYNMFVHKNQVIDVKFVPMNQEFAVLESDYNEGFIADYVRDGFENALRFGRGRLGQILVFSGGNNGSWFADPALPPQAPDYYTGAGLADLYTATNDVEIFTVDDGGGMYLDGPFHIRGQAAFYPFANDRRTLLINAVDEGLIPDIHQAFGPGVFASVVSSTSNLTMYLDAGPVPGDFPRGVTVTEPGDGYAPFADPINFPEEGNYFIASQSSGAIGAGIIALMLDVNPGLTIRDVQHILFESIFESTRPDAITFPFLDTAGQTYMIPPPAGYGGDGTEQSTWQANAALLDSPTGPRAVRHSDFYGFGIIDAELAVQKAANWGGTPRLFLLDTGLVGNIGNDQGMGGDEMETRVPVELADAEYIMPGESVAILNPGGRFIEAANQINVCVRNNIQIETIVVELTIEGNTHNDLWIELVSPNGTRSNLLLPVTSNYSGTSFADDLGDDNADNGAYSAGTFNGTEYALYRHQFTTFKHWGELAGGRWSINFYDYGVDEAMEEGDGASDDDAVPFVTTLGPFGVPGSEFRDGKEVTAFRIQFYGTDRGAPIFDACDPFETTCPGDLNGDGIVDSADMNIFVSWYLTGDARADINNTGNIDFLDLTFWIGTFTPGFCPSGGGGGNPAVGNRPSPGSNDVSDNNPVTRPI